MFADHFYNDREVDLSHFYLAGSYEFDPHAQRTDYHRSFPLFVGFLLAVGLHLSLLWWNPLEPRPIQQPSTVLLLTISKPKENLTAQKAVPVPTKQTKPPNADNIDKGKLVKPKNEGEVVVKDSRAAPDRSASVEKPSVITSLSSAELREVTQQSKAQGAAPARSHISENVFHPGLRKRLEIEASKPSYKRTDTGLSTSLDPSRATVVDPGGGNCLRSPPPNGAEPRNWYMTSCGGKFDSEQIMERVDEAVNEKLRFE